VERALVLVTGGNSGIGFECARQLARRGQSVVIASRDRELSARAVRAIQAETGNSDVRAMTLDLGSLAAVRQLAKEIAATDLPLRALVCNAGLQVQRGPVLSTDGHELTFAVNHLGHFLLVNLLLSRLVSNAPARILVVSSGVHDPAMKTGMPKPAVSDMQTLAATGGARAGAFNGRLAYVNSKLCNLWFTYELARRIAAAGLSTDARPLSVNAWEPGLVPGSGLARDYPAWARAIWSGVGPALAQLATRLTPKVNPASKSGRDLAEKVLDPAVECVSGKYFPSHTRWREAPSSELSYDEGRARELWAASARMSGLTAEESPLARLSP
jgi:NAD(P)-dependent dehydrogenase (short-subunit alcohol dehydrogenase family)